MFPGRWFKVWLVAICLSGAAHSNAELEVSDEEILTQRTAEAILHAQTIIRRHLIKTLADISHEIVYVEEFHSIVNDIIKGLHTRALDSLTALINVQEDQPSFSQMATIIYNLQGGSQEKKSLVEWTVLLNRIGHIPPLPRINVDIESLKRFDRSFVNFVLEDLKKNLRATNHLVKNILYNYLFENPSPDVYIIVSTIINKLSVNFWGFRPELESNTSSEILLDILQYIQRHSDLSYEVNQLRSSFSNVDRVKGPDKLFEIFNLMLSDDYPPDVIEAKNKISTAIRRHQIPFNRNLMFEMLKGYTPSEMLLGLTAELASTPSSYSNMARGIYPHVKLRYLSNQEEYFRPRTASDVAFLLNSFLTIPDQTNQVLIQEIPKLFVQKDIQSILNEFDFSRYSKPRPLVIDMLQHLLDSGKLSNCYVIIIKLFLKSLNNHTTDGESVGTPHATCETYNLAIDPVSLVDITIPDKNQRYLIDLITNQPIYYEEYKNLTRRQVVQEIIQRKLDKTNDPMLNSLMLMLKTSRNSERPPLVRPICTTTSHCPKERREKVINPSDIIEIIPNPSPPIEEMIMEKPIFFHQYGKYRTRGDVLKALMEDRMNDINITMNGQADLPSNFIEVCLKEPTTCQPSSVIDTQSLLEIIDNNTQIHKIFPKGPFLANKYKFLGDREKLLRHILRQHYSSPAGSILNLELMKASDELIFNEKKILPPIVKKACVVPDTLTQDSHCLSEENHRIVYDIQSALEALNSSEGTSLIQTQIKNIFIPIDNKALKTFSKAEVLELILDTLKLNRFKSSILYSGSGQNPAEVKLTCVPKNIFEIEKVLDNKCEQNEMILSIIDTDKLFTVNATYLKSRINSIILPIGNPKKYTRGEIVREVLDQLEKEISDEKVKMEIDFMKENRTEDVNLPDVIQVCLPNFVIEEIQAENSPLTSSSVSLNLSILPIPLPTKKSILPPSVSTLQPSQIHDQPQLSSKLVLSTSSIPHTSIFISNSSLSRPPLSSKSPINTVLSTQDEFIDMVDQQDNEDSVFTEDYAFTEDYIFTEDTSTVENKTQNIFPLRLSNNHTSDMTSNTTQH